MRQGDLVPAAVRPEAVHGVQHLHERDVSIERQAVVSRNARVARGEIRLRRVVLEHDCAALAHERAHQRRFAAGEPREQIEQRTLAVVERHVVEEIEHARIAQTSAARC